MYQKLLSFTSHIKMRFNMILEFIKNNQLTKHRLVSYRSKYSTYLDSSVLREAD